MRFRPGAQNSIRFREERPVTQEHALGCAVACVAYRCGMPYGQALALFERPEHAWIRGYYCSEIIEALARSGLRYSFDRFDPVRHSQLLSLEGTIVFLEPSSEYPAGHYLIRGRGVWMNPWLNFPRMHPAESGFQPELPGKTEYVIYERR